MGEQREREVTLTAPDAFRLADLEGVSPPARASFASAYAETHERRAQETTA